MKKLSTLFLTAMAAVAISHAEEVTLYVYDSDTQTYCKNYTSEVTANEDGTYTIENVLNSGAPLRIGFDGELVNDEKVNITFESNVSEYSYEYSGTTYTLYYFVDKDENYVNFTLESEDGTTQIPVYSPYFYGDGESYATPTVENDVRTITCNLNFTGDADEDATEYADYYYIIFNITDPTFASTTNVDASQSALPVEYFNLQGIRVSNPDNGIYIRRQGSNTTKVMVK